MAMGAKLPIVRLAAVSKKFGEVTAVRPLDLVIYRGDFLAILGPSGCGKTTLLNLIAGFLIPDSGSISIADKDMTRIGPEHRPTNMVFQSYGLFPHMTVRQNIAYGLRIARIPSSELNSRVSDVLDLVDLRGLEHRNATQLSGGQQQRVALARALVMRPEVLLLDEPLAALDLKLRKAMQDELRRIHRTVGGTFVFVTHDQEEAMGLASRIAVMQDGRLVQDGTAEDIYNSPSTRFVSTFIGDANVLRGVRRAGRIQLDVGTSFLDAGSDEKVVCIVRPEAMTISAQSDEHACATGIAVSGFVEDRIFLGSYVKYALVVGNERLIVHSAHVNAEQHPKIGDAVVVRWPARSHRILAES